MSHPIERFKPIDATEAVAAALEENGVAIVDGLLDVQVLEGQQRGKQLRDLCGVLGISFFVLRDRRALAIEPGCLKGIKRLVFSEVTSQVTIEKQPFFRSPVQP